MANKVRNTIIGLEQDVYQKAKSSAALQGINLGTWWNAAALEKLAREEKNGN